MIDVRSSWMIDARGFAWPLGTERTLVKRGPKPRAEMIAARAEIRRRIAQRYEGTYHAESRSRRR